MHYHSNTHFHAHARLFHPANLPAREEEMGEHLVSFVTSSHIGVTKYMDGDGCVSLYGLLGPIVPSYLPETACTVTAPSLAGLWVFVFDLLGALQLASGPTG